MAPTKYLWDRLTSVRSTSPLIACENSQDLTPFAKSNKQLISRYSGASIAAGPVLVPIRMPLRFLIRVDSVKRAARFPVRCGKSRRVVGSDASGRLRCCTGPARLSKALNVKVSADQTEYDDSRLTA